MTLRPRSRVPRTIHVLLIGICTFAAPAASGQELVIYKEGTKLYHRPGCPVLGDGAGVLALSRGQAEARGYKPHPDCDPAAATPPAAAAVPPRSVDKRLLPPSLTVYIEATKYYHRKDCAKLKTVTTDPRAVTLETAAKSHWPCPACKPPIFRKSAGPAIPGTHRRRGG